MQEKIQPQKSYNYTDASRLIHSNLEKKEDASKAITGYLKVFDFLISKNSNTALNNWLSRLKHIIEINDSIPNSVFNRINHEFEIILNLSLQTNHSVNEITTLASLQYVMHVLSNLKKEGVFKENSNLYNLNESFFILFSKYEPHFSLLQKEIRQSFFLLKKEFTDLGNNTIKNNEKIEITKEFMVEGIKFFKNLYSVENILKQKENSFKKILITPTDTSFKNINKLFNDLTYYLNGFIFYKEENLNLNIKSLQKMQKVIDKLSTAFLFSSFLTPVLLTRLNMLFKVAAELVSPNSPYQLFLQKQIHFIEKIVPKMPINYPVIELKNQNENFLKHSYLLSLISILPTDLNQSFKDFQKFLVENINSQKILSQKLIPSFNLVLNKINQSKETQKKDAFTLLATILKLANFLTFNTSKSSLFTNLLKSFNYNNQEVNLNLWNIVNRLDLTKDSLARAIINSKPKNIQENTTTLTEITNKQNENEPAVNKDQNKEKLQNNYIIKHRADMPVYRPTEHIDFTTVKESFPTLMADRIMLLDQSFPLQREEKAGTYISSFLCEKDMLILGYEDGTIKIWLEKNEKYKLERFLDIHREKITTLKLFKNYLLAGSDDSTITLWDITSFRYLMTFRGHRGPITGIYMGWHNVGLGDMEIVASSSYDGHVKIWGAKSANCLKTIEIPGEGVSSLAQQGEIFITVSKDHIIRIWDFAQLACLKTYQGHSGEVTSLISNGKLIISASKDRTIRIWDTEDDTKSDVLHGHQGQINFLLLDSKGLLYSASDDKTIRVWDLKSKRAIRLFKGPTASITCLQLKDNQLYASSEDQKLLIWDLVSGDCINHLNGSSAARDLYLKH
ncbi:MAG: hypothetical protein WC860_00355 [Candidatus Margulisiibacteriota bacterium]|jgi:WD40 repeat protein